MEWKYEENKGHWGRCWDWKKIVYYAKGPFLGGRDHQSCKFLGWVILLSNLNTVVQFSIGIKVVRELGADKKTAQESRLLCPSFPTQKGWKNLVRHDSGRGLSGRVSSRQLIRSSKGWKPQLPYKLHLFLWLLFNICLLPMNAEIMSILFFLNSWKVAQFLAYKKFSMNICQMNYCYTDP